MQFYCTYIPCYFHIIGHGEWADWLEWNSCPVTCGTGNQIRYRTCTDPEPYNSGNDCVGDDYSNQACGGGDCFCKSSQEKFVSFYKIIYIHVQSKH